MSDRALTHKQIAARGAIRLWLLVICALIFAMVIVGGATRLTGSGLSITEWKPILGAIPPLNLADWQEAFEKYKLIPQYTAHNEGMSLSEFKSIFWWEWAHRFLGRFIGMAFLFPFLFFLFTGRVERSLKPKLWVLFALGGLQGFIGWYMVASGLVDRTDVSQYRLASHLGLAVFLYAAIFWVTLGLGKEGLGKDNGGNNKQPVSSLVRNSALFITALIYLQILAGAFVAGLKAGTYYNTWPLIAGRFIPEGLAPLSPIWKNLFETILTVQFNHRMIAYLVAIAVLLHLIHILATSHTIARAGSFLLMGITILQITLGIITLLAVTPLDLALTHQAGAIILLSAALWHTHRLKLAD